MARDDDPSFDELVALAVETGREGVKALKAKPIEKSRASTRCRSTQSGSNSGKTNGTERLHGYWPCAYRRPSDSRSGRHPLDQRNQCLRIIVVSDEVAADTVRKTLLTQVAPPGVTAHVVDVAKMIRVYNNPKYAGERVMLLFTNPTDVERLVEGGVKITSVNVGGMAFRQGKTQVNNAVSVDEKDIEAFKKLECAR